MRWLRLLSVLISARFRSTLRINDASIINFKVWITDVDVSIMNHAAIMTVMETGRIDFMVRTGFFRLAQKNKWYFPSTSIHVQFFRPLKMFQQSTLITQVLFIDETWIYLEQKIVRKEKVVAVSIVKGTIKKGRAQVNVLEVLKELNIGDAPREGKELIRSYEAGDELLKERLTVSFKSQDLFLPRRT